MGQLPSLSPAAGIHNQQVEDRSEEGEHRQRRTGQPKQEEAQPLNLPSEITEAQSHQGERTAQTNQPKNPTATVRGMHEARLRSESRIGQRFAGPSTGGSVAAWRLNHSGISSKRSTVRAS